MKVFDSDIFEICKASYEKCATQLKKYSDQDMNFWLNLAYEHLRSALFPESFKLEANNLQEGIGLYIKTLEEQLALEKCGGLAPILSYDIAAGEELEDSQVQDEYAKFLDMCEEWHIFAFMRLAGEITPYKTNCHIAGVHHVAMTMARRLKKAGLDVDLAMVCAASIAHDLGKYGCRDKELRRVPYLHYYYTDKLLSKNGMKKIAYIAANHSTWDLELEDLSVESLLLIYADFRVKSLKCDGREMTVFYTLEESFDVILSKLDNVDEAKHRRYVHVYNRLRDFEIYMCCMGVSTALDEDETDSAHRIVESVTQKQYVFMNIDEAVVSYKNMAIAHNIQLMKLLSDDVYFGRMIEAARSNMDWHGLRTYLQIFEEYHTYMNQSQKLVVLKFLYELLMHREGDIRRESAILMGEVIMSYDIRYRKEVPDDAAVPVSMLHTAEDVDSKALFAKYLRAIAGNDHHVNDSLKKYMGNVLGNFVQSAVSSCRSEAKSEYLHILIKVFEENQENAHASFFICSALRRISLSDCYKADILMILRLLQRLAKKMDGELQICILVLVKYMLDTLLAAGEYFDIINKLIKDIKLSGLPSVSFLLYGIEQHLGTYEGKKQKGELTAQTLSGIFRENLKTATPWIVKETNIELLTTLMRAKGRDEMKEYLMQTAMHLSNLLTVSASSIVRRRAGAGLIELSGLMNKDQLNEVAIELLNGLSLGEYEFAKYIPQYLGVIINKLDKNEYDEFIAELERIMVLSNDKTALLALDTIGVVLESTQEFMQNCAQLCGLLLRGFSSFRGYVSEEAFYVIGSIFSGDMLSPEKKAHIFSIMYKKMLDMLCEHEEEGLMFYISAAALNHIYRFLADYLQTNKKIKTQECKKVVFFPGTFDPFTLSHKEIALEMCRMGFEVYLAIDEFSWSKRTQPNLVRRRIARLSTAAQQNINLFPKDIPVNLSCTEDMRTLRRLFKGKKLYLATGSDVIENASAYKKKPSRDSVHAFNHIVFLRRSSLNSGTQPIAADVCSYENIKGEVITLKLPIDLEDISSSSIRSDIDNGHDISGMVDMLAQRYIYERSLYLREQQNKSILSPGSLKMQLLCDVCVDELKQDYPKLLPHAEDIEHFRAMKLFDERRNEHLCGICIYTFVEGKEYFKIFRDIKVSEALRRKTSGRLLLICALHESRERDSEYAQLLLTEVLSAALSQGYCFAAACVSDANDREYLRRQGFDELEEDSTIMLGDMRSPCTLISNISAAIKEPFSTNENVARVVYETHRKLQSAFAQLYPGQLTLSIDSGVLHHKLVEKITASNNVPKLQTPVRTLGKKICVPYGSILRGHAVPNTVTKTLHTEKVYSRDIESFEIVQYPEYLSLEDQLRTIHSFERPVMLVDDLLHKGYRLQKLTPILRSAKVDVEEIIVGILTGRGRDLAQVSGLPVSSAYYIPNMRAWFSEAALYPFIGGDSVDSSKNPALPGIKTSINMILPYMQPHFMKGCESADFYRFSMTCLENARDIMRVLEAEYQRVYEKNLTLDRLGEVLYTPTLPDKGINMWYEPKSSASVYLENEIETLERMKCLCGIH